MDLGFNILLFVHLVALVVGAATNVAMPLVAGQMARAAPEARAGLGAIARALGINTRIAVAVLIASGLAMVWVRYGGFDLFNTWFWVKMVLVVLIVALMVVGSVLPPGKINPRLFGMVARVVLLGIILTAVFAFN